MFEVCKKRCDECLFSTNKIVDDERKAEVLDDCLKRGDEKHFVCHKWTLVDPDSKVCCRGFWDTFPDATAAMQVAQRLGFVEYVDFPDGAL